MTLAVAMAVAQLADLATFLVMVGAFGMGAEVNPIARAIAPTADRALLAKVGLIVFVLLVARLCEEADMRWPIGKALATLMLAAGAVVGAYGAWSNLAVLLA